MDTQTTLFDKPIAETSDKTLVVSSVDSILAQVSTAGLSVLGGAESMRHKLEEYEAIRAVILDYIERNFVEGIDYGPSDPRSDKKTLLKPGAEKVCRMFNTHPTWTRDNDTWEMLGKPEGVCCYLCQIIDNSSGKIVGEGRGAEKVGNKARDVNKTIKIAEKCSIVDAALYTFTLSEKFTQDAGTSGTDLANHKKSLMSDIQILRAGIVSDKTDLAWLTGVMDQEIHKKRIDTIGELMHLRKAILEQKKYDFQTGALKK